MSPRDRAALGVLVANRGASVSADRLADALWGDDVPESGRKIVQGVVVRLRKALGQSAIETTPGGYRLVLAGEDVDAWRFGDLVDRARELLDLGELDRALYALDEALDLWRGAPLPELERWPPAAGQIARLQQLRGAAEERRLEALVGLGRHDEAVAAASALVAAEPLRERRWELLALALYRSGRQGEALRAIARARATLREELGIEPRSELAELERAILNQDPGLAGAVDGRPRASERCPYKGLEAYDVRDAESFFGRDGDVDACRRRLSAAGFLVLAGASGSGKSSVVRAGLVPRLRAEGRDVAICVPGADPPAAVATALAASGEDVVLVVDQAEELFTACDDVGARERFAEAVAAHAARQPVVLVLRADHVGTTASHPGLRRMVEDGLHLLGQMTEPQLREAIERPAREAGLRLEPGLVDLLVRDVVNEPGGLPLLSHALAETWARREGRVLTVAGYRDAGGVHGAVARTAERLYEELPDDQRSKARALMLRLVELLDGGEPVRHRLPRSAVDQQDGAARHVLDVLLRARLVTAGQDSLEIAHEALAHAWPRLRSWLDEDREGQRLLRHLIATAQAWVARVRDPAELYRGNRLEAAEAWASAHPGELTATESAFLAASRAASETERRRHHQLTRRLRRQVGALSVLGVVTLITASLAVAQLGDGDRGAGGRSDGPPGTIDEAALTRSGPMTPQKAALFDLDVDFGPGCDAERGTIELPSALAPPCVEPFAGDNGGATAPGVTADEVKIVRYDGGFGSVLVPTAGRPCCESWTAVGDGSLADVDRAVDDYVALYNEVFETYGRRVVVERFGASGPDGDSESARRDARAIAELEPFAVIGGPNQANPAFARELARLGVVCGPGCATGLPGGLLERHDPYLLQAGPTPEQAGAMAAEAFGKLAGPGRAELAGDPALRRRERVYVLVHYDTPEGDYQPAFDAMRDELARNGIDLADDIEFDLELATRTRVTAQSIIGRLRDVNATTVIYAGDPLTPIALTAAATAQGYRPEWLLGPNLLADTTVIGRLADRTQWSNGFGLALNTAGIDGATVEAPRIYEWAYGRPLPARLVAGFEPYLRTVFTGIHLAGPELTPESFRDGLFRYPVAGGRPGVPRTSWGDHDIWPGVDYGGSDDAALVWFDPRATGRDELGAHGRGMVRYANRGGRYTVGSFPTSWDEAGLFDVDRSASVDERPAEPVPEYPPPDP